MEKIRDGKPKPDVVGPCRILDQARPPRNMSPEGGVAVVFVAVDGNPKQPVQLSIHGGSEVDVDFMVVKKRENDPHDGGIVFFQYDAAVSCLLESSPLVEISAEKRVEVARLSLESLGVHIETGQLAAGSILDD